MSWQAWHAHNRGVRCGCCNAYATLCEDFGYICNKCPGGRVCGECVRYFLTDRQACYKHARHPKLPGKQRLRFAVFTRDGFRCRYCGDSPKTDDAVILELDHLIPKVAGGRLTLENTITACRPCNRGKAARVLTDDELEHLD